MLLKASPSSPLKLTDANKTYSLCYAFEISFLNNLCKMLLCHMLYPPNVDYNILTVGTMSEFYECILMPEAHYIGLLQHLLNAHNYLNCLT